MLLIFQKTLKLEIGFGCGHHNHGTSARMWKKYFEGGSGPGLSLFEIEYGPYEPHEKCVGEFLKTYPIGTVCDGIFLVRKMLHLPKSVTLIFN